MNHEITCPKGHRVTVTEAHLGKRVSCPTCGETFNVPAVIPEVQPVAVTPQIETAPRTAAARHSMPALDVGKLALLAGRAALALGLVLVVLARGCDVVGKRGVERAQARVGLERAVFNDKWDRQVNDVQRKLKAIQDKENRDPDDAKRTSDLREELNKLQKDRDKDRETFEQTTLQELQIAARDAQAANAMNAYWRAMFFVFASVVFALGLVAVGSVAQGAERWVCLVAIAIIVFSLYIFGIAWTPLPG